MTYGIYYILPLSVCSLFSAAEQFPVKSGTEILVLPD